MPATRRTKPQIKFQNHQKYKQYERQRPTYDLVQSMMQEMSENNLDPQILVPTNPKIQMMEQQLQQRSFIMMGPGHSGKTAAVHWLTREMEEYQHIIEIDCNFWKSDASFIGQLIEEVSLIIKRQLLKNLVVKQNISFKELNRVIEKEGVELVIVMKNPEKMEQGRPVLMYNIFEWMNSVQVNQHLRFILITREITFLDTREKRVRSRMNMPLVFCAPPRTDKIKQIIIKRIEHCARLNPSSENLCLKLKRALQQKQLEKIINAQLEKKSQPISYYLKMMQLVLAVGIESEEKWGIVSQRDLNDIVSEGFQEYGEYILDHRTIAKSFFQTSHIPEIILMGLYRNRFLRQKEGSYTCPITLGQLMNDFNQKKSKVKLEEGGSSFLFSENMMEVALKNLIDWNFLTFSRGDKVAVINREIDSRYGPEDIAQFYLMLDFLPNIVKQIYSDK